MKASARVIHVHEAEKMTCAELANAISVATENVQRYSKLKESSSKIMEAAEKHFIALLDAQIKRSI